MAEQALCRIGPLTISPLYERIGPAASGRKPERTGRAGPSDLVVPVPPLQHAEAACYGAGDVPPQTLGAIYSLGCALLWAVAVLLFRKGGDRVPPLALNGFKGAVAILCTALTLPLVGVAFIPQERTLEDWLILLASGAIGIGIADSLFFASLNLLGASGSAVINCSYSPFVVLLASAYLGEPLRATLLLAVALMVGAIALVSWEPAVSVSSEGQGKRRRRQGVLLGVLATCLTAGGIVLAKPVLVRVPVLWATQVRLVGGEVVIALNLLRRSERQAILGAFRPGPLWLIIIPPALLGSYLATIVWMAGMKYAQAGVAGVLNQTSALFIPLLSALFLKERLSSPRIFAVLLGFIGALSATV